MSFQQQRTGDPLRPRPGTSWAIITGEYPPQLGGVADYTKLVATGLVAVGASVAVYAPPTTETAPSDPGVTLHRLSDRFNAQGLAQLDRLFRAPARPDRLLVQYAPHGFGWKGMNVPFSWWVYKQARKGNKIDLVVHEPFLRFGHNPKYWLVSAAQRVMIWLLLRASRRVWCPIPMWEQLLRPLAPRGLNFCNLPVCSSVPVGPALVGCNPRPYALGCFSSFGPQMARPLAGVLELLLPRVPGSVLLIGLRSKAFREQFVATHPGAADRLVATGPVELATVPALLNSCDLMLQPLAGGVSGRNTATLACLRNGRPVVTTTGPLTESFWVQSGAVALAPGDDFAQVARQVERVLGDADFRSALAHGGRELYARRFDLSHTIAALMEGS